MKRATREHEHAPFPPERHAPNDKTSKLRARRSTSNYARYGLYFLFHHTLFLMKKKQFVRTKRGLALRLTVYFSNFMVETFWILLRDQINV